MAAHACIPDLVARLSSGDAAAQREAAGALKDLALRGHADRSAIMAAGGVLALLQCMADAPVAVLAAAADALCPLTMEPAAAATILAAGAVPFLVEILRACASLGAASERRFVYVATALCNLAHADGGATAILEAGVLRTLLDVLQSGRPQSQHAAAGVIANVASRAAVEEQFVAVVPPLVRCLQDAELQPAAAAALGNIGACPAVQSAALAAGSIPLLLQCMDSCSEGTSSAAVAAIANLCFRNTECSGMVAAAGAVSRLLALASSADGRTALGAIIALHNVIHASPKEACKAFEDAGGVPVLVQLVNGASPVVAERAAWLVGRLAQLSPELQDAFRAAGGHALGQLLLSFGILDDDLEHMFETARVELRRDSLAAGAQLESTAAAAAAAAAAEAATAAALSAEPATLNAAQAGGSTAPQLQPSPPAPPIPRKVCAAPGCGATRGLRRCGGCGTVRYCSEACSRVHWREHRAECRRLQAAAAAAAAHGPDQ